MLGLYTVQRGTVGHVSIQVSTTKSFCITYLKFTVCSKNWFNCLKKK